MEQSLAVTTASPRMLRVHLLPWLLPLSVCLGAALGTYFGYRPAPVLPEQILLISGADIGGESILRVFCLYAVPCFAAGLLSATLFGFFLIPLLFFLRGFLFSFSAASIMLSGTSAGSACLLLGAPALFSFFALFLLGEEAFCSSLDIYRTCRGYPRIRFSLISADRFLLAVLLNFAAAAVRVFLIPPLLK